MQAVKVEEEKAEVATEDVIADVVTDSDVVAKEAESVSDVAKEAATVVAKELQEENSEAETVDQLQESLEAEMLVVLQDHM